MCEGSVKTAIKIFETIEVKKNKKVSFVPFKIFNFLVKMFGYSFIFYSKRDFSRPLSSVGKISVRDRTEFCFSVDLGENYESEAYF